jgi:hypothetical protein
VDYLLGRGVRCVTVLDISGAALRRAQDRLPGAPVRWIQSDVAGDWSAAPADFWHDRAVFHFLTDAADRARYKEHLTAILKPGGQAIIATFALEGPHKCSGLPVVRYSGEALAAELGSEFRLVEAVQELHHTPTGVVQPFCYSRFVKTQPEPRR